MPGTVEGGRRIQGGGEEPLEHFGCSTLCFHLPEAFFFSFWSNFRENVIKMALRWYKNQLADGIEKSNFQNILGNIVGFRNPGAQGL